MPTTNMVVGPSLTAQSGWRGGLETRATCVSRVMSMSCQLLLISSFSRHRSQLSSLNFSSDNRETHTDQLRDQANLVD